jgi:hypothetical protein
MRDELQPARAKRASGRQDPHWFAVTILFRSILSGSSSLRPLCEEQVVLFQSKTVAETRSAAISYARDVEHTYKNVYAEDVEWRFVRIERIDDLEDPASPQGLGGRQSVRPSFSSNIGGARAERPPAAVTSRGSYEAIGKGVPKTDVIGVARRRQIRC